MQKTYDRTETRPRLAFMSILLPFLKLGLTSFGGPIAHLGYFRTEFVSRRKWLDDSAYADLVALCQFLPGPASSQVGFSIGLMRGGLLGGLAAWLGFTLPSALVLVLFAYGLAGFDTPLAQGALHGLKVVAVAVIAQAIWGMARQLCPDRPRIAIAVTGVVAVVFLGGVGGQLTAIAIGAFAGLWFCQDLMPAGDGTPHAPFASPIPRIAALVVLLLAVALLFLLPAISAAGFGGHGLALFDAFYRAGALVFGGGHVVLPLLQVSVVQPGWISGDDFLAGYGAAQAVPGPLFTFAAYLGAANGIAPNGWLGAAIALVGIFLPGLLLILGTLPFWERLRRHAMARAILSGVNAAVVGLLAAALYDPVWVSAITGPRDFALALICFMLLTAWKMQPWIVVLLSACGGMLLAIPGLAAG